MAYVLVVVKKDRPNADSDQLEKDLKSTAEVHSSYNKTVANGLAIVLVGVLELSRSSITDTCQRLGFAVVEGPTVFREPPVLTATKIYTILFEVTVGQHHPDLAPLAERFKTATGATEVEFPPAILRGTMRVVLMGVTDLSKTSTTSLSALLAHHNLRLSEQPTILEGNHPTRSSVSSEDVAQLWEQVKRTGRGQINFP